jgi:hypothetical protein
LWLGSVEQQQAQLSKIDGEESRLQAFDVTDLTSG